MDLPYLAADVFFLQKEVPFVCVCVCIFSIWCELGKCLFQKGMREHISPISPHQTRTVKGLETGQWAT